MSIFDLPDIQFVETNPEAIENEVITTYQAISGRTLAPGDPVRLFLLALTQPLIQQRVLMDLTAKQNLLRYATGDILDHLGALVDTARLEASAAVVTVRFSLAAVRPDTVSIPVGTRVSPGGDLFYITTAYAEIPAGQTTVEVICECVQTGTIGNGYIAGQINILVDPLPWVTSVTNTTVSAGGADQEADDPYRERIRTSPERFSVAGPAGAYAYWARTANPSILDVSVYSPAPVEVVVVLLMAGGELPTQTILDEVAEVLNTRTKRPLTDKVSVSAPEVVEYDIDLTYYVDTDQASSAAAIQVAVQQAVSDYVLWQKSRLGRDINPSELIRRVMNAGAKRVEIANPVRMAVDLTTVAIAGTVTVTFGGLEDD